MSLLVIIIPFRLITGIIQDQIQPKITVNRINYVVIDKRDSTNVNLRHYEPIKKIKRKYKMK